jgi:hypothetical protein
MIRTRTSLAILAAALIAGTAGVALAQSGSTGVNSASGVPGSAATPGMSGKAGATAKAPTTNGSGNGSARIGADGKPCQGAAVSPATQSQTNGAASASGSKSAVDAKTAAQTNGC